jgi:hypothetical protein
MNYLYASSKSDAGDIAFHMRNAWTALDLNRLPLEQNGLLLVLILDLDCDNWVVPAMIETALDYIRPVKVAVSVRNCEDFSGFVSVIEKWAEDTGRTGLVFEQRTGDFTACGGSIAQALATQRGFHHFIV